MARLFSYSDLVTGLKVILPLAALGLLSTLFLVSRDVDMGQSIPFAEIELEKRLRDQQITAPHFSGLTSQGHSVTLTAATAHPDAIEPSRTIAEKLNVTILTASGTQITVTSDEGEVDGEFQEVVLEGDVRIATTAGFDIETEVMTFGLADVRAETGGRVVAQTQFGRLDAGRMALRPTGDTDDIYLFFTKGVRLLYTPNNTTR